MTEDFWLDFQHGKRFFCKALKLATGPDAPPHIQWLVEHGSCVEGRVVNWLGHEVGHSPLHLLLRVRMYGTVDLLLFVPLWRDA